MRILLAVAGSLITSVASAQTIDYAVEGVDYSSDIKVEIVDSFADEKWEIVGGCTNFSDLKVEFVDYSADMKVEIVDYFGDRKICITNADELDARLLRRLNLID